MSRIQNQKFTHYEEARGEVLKAKEKECMLR